MKKTLFILSLLLQNYLSQAQEIVVIDKGVSMIEISKKCLVLNTKETEISFEKISKQKFEPYVVAKLLSSPPTNILWLKFEIQNNQTIPQKLILYCGKNFFYDLFQTNADGTFQSQIGGLFSSWEKLIDGYGLPIVLLPKQKSVVFVRIGTDSFYTKNLLITPKLYSEDAYKQKVKFFYWEKRYLGLFYALAIGFLACGILASLFQYFSYPDKAILHYILVIILSEVMIFRVAEYHLGLRIISTYFPSFFLFLYTLQVILGIGYLIFIASVFNIKVLRPKIYKVLKTTFYFYILLMIFSIWATIIILEKRSILNSSFQVSSILTILLIFSILIVAYLSYSLINTYNKYIFYGFLSMVIGYGITFYLNRIQEQSSVEIFSFWQTPSVYMCLGILFELLFFMIALGIRSNLLQEEAIVKGQTLERKRIASELHNNVNSILASVKVNLQLMLPQTSKEKQIYENVLKMVDNASNEVRQISHNMLPIELEKEGLEHALQALIIRLNLGGQTHFELSLNSPNLKIIDLEIAFNLYTICMELCQNIQKHSEATNAQIELQTSHNQLVMFVSDNGKGFEKNKISEGMGLKNIRHRAKTIGADLKIKSELGEGTTVYLILKS